MVILHTHKGGVRICLGKAIAIAKVFVVLVIPSLAGKIFLNRLNGPL
jgi:hypothetical protein